MGDSVSKALAVVCAVNIETLSVESTHARLQRDRGEATTYDWASVCELRTSIALPEEGEIAGWEEVPRIQSRMHHLRLFIIIRPLFNHQN